MIAIAHGRHAAGDLRDAARLARRLLDDRRKTLVRLVGRQHVVIGGHDGEIGDGAGAQIRFFMRGAGGKSMREIGAAERAAARAVVAHRRDAGEICLARRLAALANAGRDIGDCCVNHLRLLVAIGRPNVRRGKSVKSFLHSSCARRARQARSRRLAPMCPRNRDAAVHSSGSRPRGSDRSSATPPRPRRGA